MERRIKLSTEDLGIIADCLEVGHDSAIDSKRNITHWGGGDSTADLASKQADLAEIEEHIEQVGRLMVEFKGRHEADLED